MKVILIIFFLLNFSPVNARPVEVQVRDYGWLTSFPVLKDVLDFYLQGVEDDINEEQPIINPSRINLGTANSSVVASKGLGTDYANDPEKYLIGVGIGVAWDNEKNVAIRDDISGAAAASSVSFGKRINEDLMGFVNFGTFTYSRIIPSGEIDIAGDIQATNFGLHARYDLGWGGLKLHVGYEYNANTINLSSTLDEPLEVDTGGSGVLQGRLTGRPTYKVKTRTHSIPIEVSKSFSFLSVFSVYGGLGVDANYGTSKGEGEIKGDVATLACTSGICAGETVLPQLEAVANYDAESKIRNVSMRGFAGVQVDLPLRLHAYGQVEKVFGNEIMGVSAGLKYSF